MSVLHKFIGLSLVLLLGGCAIGQTTDYSTGTIEFTWKPTSPFAVSVVDNRPYVINGKKSPQFTGLVRSLYGIPYNRNTKSGNSLADDLGMMLVKTFSLGGLGFKYTASPLKFESITPLQRILVYDIKEWKTDSMHRTSFRYDVTAKVLDSDGKLIEKESLKGEQMITGSYSLADAIKDLFNQLHTTEVQNAAVAI